MAKKVELEAGRNEYLSLSLQAAVAAKDGDFREALRYAVASLPFVGAHVDFERRYEKSATIPLPTLDVILAYAPPYFDVNSLTQLERLCDDKKTLKKLGRDLASEVKAAWLAMELASRLWGKLAEQTDPPGEKLKIRPGTERAAIAAWERCGAVALARNGDSRYQLVTVPARPCQAVCPECGAATVRAKVELLAGGVCATCRARVSFVLRGDAQRGSSR